MFKAKIKQFINSQKFLGYLIALVLSTILIGFAPSSIALGIFVFFSIRYFIIHKQKLKIDSNLLLPIALYFLFFITLFWSVDIDQTKKGLARTVVLILVPIAFNLIPKFTLKSFYLIFRIFTGTNILLGIFFLISAFIRYTESFSLGVFTYHELVSDLELNAIYVSVIFSISLFYLLSKKTKTFQDNFKIVFFIILGFLLSSKLMLIILAVAILVYMFSFRVNRVKLVYLIIMGTVIVYLAPKKLMERFLFEKETKIEEVWTKKEFGHVYLWTGTSIRLLQLRILKDQLKEEAIFWKGFGLYASRDNTLKRHIKFNTYPGFHTYNYHNQYAQIFSETGIFGLGLLLGMLGILFVNALNSKDFLFIMFSITITFVFFTETFLWRQTGLFLFIILYSLLNRTVFENEVVKINNRNIKRE
ncbi:O-antigen ligase [Flavobacteriaceae bacterium MAR_2010_188]|nr:O-antigen ligase [Flavobacteriaceae bacterium MAR_2010_188]